MVEATKPIERLFFESFLKLCLTCLLTVMAVDFAFTHFAVARSVIIDFSILVALAASFLLYRFDYFVVSVLLIAFITMAAMFYQSIEADSITTSSMAVVMVIGFSFSILLKGKTPMILHGITLFAMALVFSWLAVHPADYGKPDASDIIVAGVTYGILYILIALSSLRLKRRYDDILKLLASTNQELMEKSHEIETQNEELVQGQENLHQLNLQLEDLVTQRTQEVQKQNDQLIRYAYSNAHHLRGPVARLLGLVQLSKMETNFDYPLVFKKIEEQAKELDEVVKSINKELEE